MTGNLRKRDMIIVNKRQSVDWRLNPQRNMIMYDTTNPLHIKAELNSQIPSNVDQNKPVLPYSPPL